MAEIEIKLKKLTDTAILPTYGTEGAAAFDLYADVGENVEHGGKDGSYLYYVVHPHHNVKIPTGIAMAIPHDYVGLLFARSGKACNENLRPANCVGVVDEDYRGNVTACIHNDGTEPRIIEVGERVCQMLIVERWKARFILCDDLDETARGAGGFGSTGKN